MLSVRPITRKTYGRTASDRQITDDLIDALVKKAEAGYEIEGMTDRVELTKIREEVRRIAAAHGAGNARLVGSAGRGEEGASSDLDLLVDMAEGRTLFDLIALSNDLEERLGVKVDVVTEASLSPYLRDRVLNEAIAL
jgi:hypothetical protein